MKCDNGQHKFVQEPGKTKEVCVYCGARRLPDPTRCNHEFVIKEGYTKMRCRYCNAARPLKLVVQNIESVNEVEDIQPKKKSFFKRIFSKER